MSGRPSGDLPAPSIKKLIRSDHKAPCSLSNQGFEDRNQDRRPCLHERPQASVQECITSVSNMVPGADHVHGSFTNSASSILRRRIHGFAIPATTTSGSSKSISASTSSSMATAGNRATPSSMRRSRNASRSASAPPGTTWKTARGCFRDSRWIIATMIPSDRLALLPICSSPVSGLERCAIS